MKEAKKSEVQISKEIKEIKERNIMGVAAIILSQDGKILVIQETGNNPVLDKRVGDWSIPAETIEEGETEFEALLRLIKEEVGENGDIRCRPENDWIGDYRLGDKVNIWGRAYLLHFDGISTMQRTFTAEREEVINHHWIDPQEIRNLPRRRGVLEIVEDFMAGQRGIVREECSPGFRPNYILEREK